MSQDIRLAFEHPIARARATERQDQNGPLDRISLRDHVVEVEIGAFQAERGTTQRICFNVVVEVRPVAAPLDDDVDRILSYDKVTEAIAFELAAERLNLLETLAARIADRILLEPQAERVFVRIEKLDRGPGALGVEIVRSADERSAAAVLQSAPRPHLVFLGNEAIASPHLGAWLDQLEARAEPVILCVGPHDGPVPKAQNPLAQRRIDLLAMEQNAWTLAARDKRCVVTATRTELDWAMKHGQICVWAPSKMLLDAPQNPLADLGTRAPLSLALWLGGQMTASDLLLIGAQMPKGAETVLPLRQIAATSAQI
ncbi:dihydroneopterin aldolase [Litorivita sp. NS0012-18]|uniref:dihydroneopterin aldolase n=1 Tax=Litorivita sp. NS0012-18 TaxID=3127655 RepID=UPI003103FEC0